MTAQAVETLRKARLMWPDIVDAEFLKRFLHDGTISKEEMNEIMGR